MTQEECVAHGGHCWSEATGSMVLIRYRSCKHCDQRQRGVEQPSVRWEDDK